MTTIVMIITLYRHNDDGDDDDDYQDLLKRDSSSNFDSWVQPVPIQARWQISDCDDNCDNLAKLDNYFNDDQFSQFPFSFLA